MPEVHGQLIVAGTRAVGCARGALPIALGAADHVVARARIAPLLGELAERRHER